MDPPDAAPSPQASAEPTPLAYVPSSGAGASSRADGGAAPEPLRSDRYVEPDLPREVPRDLGAAKDPARDARDLSGYALQAVIRAGEGPPPPKGPEVNLAALEAARRKTEARMSIEASASRARFVLASGFLLPPGTELRAREDRTGHILVLPGEDTYRVAEAGALRALFGERRLDVAPVSPVEVSNAGEGQRRLNLRTRRVDIATRAAKATFELAAFRDAGDGGGLVCRMLLDLMGASPASSPCGADDVPLHADLRWTTQGTLVFDVVNIARRTDMPPQDLAAPPVSASFLAGPPPPSGGEVLLARGDLAALRTAPVEVAPLADAQAPPESGLLLVNSADAPRVAWLDGVAVAWVASRATVALPSLLRGRFTLQWRSFLGDAWEPAQTVVTPGRSEVGSGS